MTVYRSLNGTLCQSFTIGLQGPTIWQGQSEPDSSIGQDGDLFVVQSLAGGFYKKLLGAWVSVESATTLAQTQTLRGVNLTLSVNDTVVAVLRNPFTIDAMEVTIDSEEATIDNSPMATTTITLTGGAEGESVVIKDDGGLAAQFNIVVQAQIDDQPQQTIETNLGFLELLYSGGEWRVVGR